MTGLGAFQVSSSSLLRPLGVSAPPKNLKRTRSLKFSYFLITQLAHLLIPAARLHP